MIFTICISVSLHVKNASNVKIKTFAEYLPFFLQLTAEARCTLVSWLIPVHKHFRLSFECLCLTVNIMDRFLASTPVAADCFQLLGVTALLLASKEVRLWMWQMLNTVLWFHVKSNLLFSLSPQVEVCSPRVSNLLSFCCDAFTKEQLCNLECLILLRLDFRLAAPTLAFFLDYYINVIKAAQFVSENKGADQFSRMHTDSTTLRRCNNFARKVSELSLADYAFNKYPPSLIASCALRLASDLLKTKQAFVEHATIPSQENQWGSFVDELCPHPGSAQASKSPECSESDSLSSLMDHLLSVHQGSYNHSLAQECKDNLKLLVSLNKETLEIISTM